MAIYELMNSAITPIKRSTFREVEVREREHLQRAIRERVDVVSPDTLVLAEEFGEWDDSRRRIDLLGLDKNANLVVIELKRTEDGGHMELQAIRYAAMVSMMTFDRAVDIHSRYLRSIGRDEDDASASILEFLDWEEPDEDSFAQDVRIVLASAEFSRELTTSVLWLNERGLDIRCVRMGPYNDNGRVLLDVQQVIPIPEAEEYQVKLREKSLKERASRESSSGWTKYNVTAGGKTYEAVAKRWAVYHIVQHLCANDVTPQRILSKVTTRKTNAFFAVDGEIRDEHAFVRAAKKQARANGRPFDERRFFCDSDQLIVSEGRTYALTKRWGGLRSLEWVDQLRTAFPNIKFEIEVAQD